MNICKVELFDAETGVKQHEQERHNYLVPAMTDLMKAMSRLTISWGGYYQINTFVTDAREPKAFEYMVLTNNSDAIDTNESVFDSETVVGFAQKDVAYVGTDVLRGTVNQNESIGVNDYHKLVFDFGTDKANGTFQSIFFSETADISSTKLLANAKAPSRGENFYCLCEDSNYIYVVIGQTEIMRYNVSTYEYVDTITLTVAVTGSPIDITVVGSDLYIVTNTTADNLIKYQNDGTHIISYTPVASTILKGVAYRPSDGLLYLTYGNSLYTCTLTGASVTLVQPLTGHSGGKLATTSSGTLYMNYSTYIVEITIGGSIELVGSTYVGIVGITLSATDTVKVIAVEKQYWSNSSSSDVARYGIAELDIDKAYNVNSRVRLDTPVTKTSAQTMKITYTFNYS